MNIVFQRKLANFFMVPAAKPMASPVASHSCTAKYLSAEYRSERTSE